MRQEKNNIFAGVDLILIFFYVILVGFGWINIYAASKSEQTIEILDFSTKYGKQLLWLSLCIPLIIAILFFNSKFYERFSSIFYLVGLFLLLLLFVFGKEINGAKAWFSFGGISLQPAEFVKAFTSMAIAKLLSDRKYNLGLLKNQIKAFIVIFFPALLIVLQPDPGSALIYLSFFLVLHREGLTMNYLIFGTLAIILFLLTIFFGETKMFIWGFLIITISVIYFYYRGGKRFLRFNGLKILLAYLGIGLFIYGTGFVYDNVFKQHHRDRFEVLLGLKIDNKNIGYNTHQSETAISSGGFYGKGFLKGNITKGNFVPEQHTDYIFSTIGEEWGFVGSASVIIIFMLMIARIIFLSEKQINKFGRIYGYSLASILFFHVTVNIGMVIGLLPTVGIPLPFFSYGGSSLWGFTILLFIFIRLDAHKNYNW